ncbi:MAG: Panacea domain-containing protein [Acidobacteriota bacterium]
MKPHFNEAKTAQLAALILKLRGGTMHYMKLIKLMYIIDRTALIRWGRPLTYDSYVSMKHGPVLSATLDLINEPPDESSPWGRLIGPATDRYCVTLKADCPTDELSDAEEELVAEGYKRFGYMNRYRLRDILHEVLPEWQDPKGSSLPIEYRDILMAAKKTPAEIAEIESELESVALVDALT